MASRLERLVSIDAYIRAGNHPSVQKLCDMFEVQPRTIYQDLRELREMFGLDIRFDRELNGYYNADPSKQLPPLAMTYEEALLMTLAIEMLSHSLGPSVQGALARASEMLRANDERKFEWITEYVRLQDHADCEVRCSVLVTVLRAAMQRQATILYLDGTPEKIIAMPSAIRFTAGHWHFVGTDTNNGGQQVELPLCRVAEAQPSNKQE